MTTPTSDKVLEDRLRGVLARDADRAPAATLTHDQFHALRERDVMNAGSGHRAARTRHPSGRHQATRRRAQRRLGIAAAAIAAVSATVFGLTGHDSLAQAFASWTSTPAPISTADVAAVSARCGQGRVSGAGGATQWPVNSAPAIVDRRGHSAHVVFHSGDLWVDCLATIPGLTPDKGLPDTWVSLSSTDAGAAPPDAANPVQVASVKSPEGNDVKRAPASWISGRVAPTVARVTITTSHGPVEATVHDRLFAAWWPGNDADTDVIHAYDSSGHLIATVDQLTCDGPGPRTHLPGHPATGGC
jgi:hypothetical protein